MDPVAIPLALLFAVALGVPRMGLTIAAPVIGILLTPAPLGRRLVGPVVRILLELLPLSAPASFPLAFGLEAACPGED